MVKKEYVYKNTINKRIPQKNCQPGGVCSESTQNNRKYYAPFRQPVKGYRKTKNGDDNTNDRCLLQTEIYKDSYTNCLNNQCTIKVPFQQQNYQVETLIGLHGISTRSRPLIRSGMQPNTAGQQNSGMEPTKNQYSYSYRELLNNRRKQINQKNSKTKPSGRYMSEPKSIWI